MIFSRSRLSRELENGKKYLNGIASYYDDFSIFIAFKYPDIIHFTKIQKIKDNFMLDYMSSLCGSSQELQSLFHARSYASYCYNTRVNMYNIRQSSSSFKKIPYYQKNQLIIELALRTYGSTIGFIHDDLLTDKHAALSISRSSHAFRYMPHRLITSEMIKHVISMDSFNVFHVPEDMLTFEHAILALDLDENAFEYLPEHMKTRELAIIVLRIAKPGSLSTIQALRIINQE